MDNCSTRCITNSKSDYVGVPRKVHVLVKGIAGFGAATHVGTVRWNIEDDRGVVHEHLIPNTYLHESSPYRLLSPQHWSQEAKDGRGTWCATYFDAVELFWKQHQYVRTVYLDSATNVALIRSSPSYSGFSKFCAQASTADCDVLNEKEFMCMPCMPIMVSDDEEDSDDESQAYDFPPAERRHPDIPDEVFDSHQVDAFENDPEPWKMSFDGIGEDDDGPHVIPEDEDVQAGTPQAELLAWHYRLGHLPFRRIQAMAKRGDLPARLLDCKVPTCASCFFGKNTRRAWRSKAPVNKFRAPPAKKPGDVVAVDQLVSATPGLIGQMKGFITRKRFTITTVFVDHFSGLSFVHNQTSADAEQTIEAKRAFERFARAHGVSVKHYHADNGIFASAKFVEAVHRDHQTISFCAVNAHHQNGVAEKRIRDLQDAARTMLLHASQRWPEAVSASLWPFAIRMANDVANSAPTIKDPSISPIELFSQVQVAPRVKHSHTFGSPVYVLDSRLQELQRLPKWNNRSRIGVYLGTSPRHSRKVALVLNLQTGHVSPQFHCKFDDLCETLRPSAGNRRVRSLWQEKTGFFDEKVTSAKLTEPETEWRSRRMSDPHLETEWPLNYVEATGDDEHGYFEDDSGSTHDNDGPAVTAHESGPERRTRSGRVVKPVDRYEPEAFESVMSLYVPWDVFHDEEMDFQDQMANPISFSASSSPDILYYKDAMRAPDAANFKEAMVDEINSHTDNGHWKVVGRDKVPKGTKVLPSVWAFRRKRRIATQEVYKWKSRINIHGGKQEYGVNYWETYSPVVGWSTIRLFLSVMLMNNWVSRQVDFVLAFPQADIECDMYMEIPQGFVCDGKKLVPRDSHPSGSGRNHCLKLKKNLYGQKQAGRVWNQYLHDGMIARGFQQSEVDMCVYYRGSVMILLFVDDGIFLGPSNEEIEECYQLMVKPFIDKDGKEWRAFRHDGRRRPIGLFGRPDQATQERND